MPASEQNSSLVNPSRVVDGASPQAGIYWSWACRKVRSAAGLELEELPAPRPSPGDVALLSVNTMGFHKHITTAENRRLRLYPGAQFIGVFGNRYASDAFEAEVEGLEHLDMLTAAGMIGTVKSKHRDALDPTQISLVGLLRDVGGERLNLKNR